MKPVLPLEWEPSKISYQAWQEIHSRAHTIIDVNSSGGSVPASRQINTTAPLTGGGNLSADRTLSILANGITNLFLAQMPTLTLKGNNTAGIANAADLTAAQAKTLLAISLTTDVSGTLQGAQFPALTGDVTTPGGSLATTIGVNVVTNAKAAQMPAGTLKGNNTVGIANATDLTATQATAMLNVFTTALQGLVPASGGGTLNFLRADGSFAVPAGTTSGANPIASVGLVTVNGVATTYLRSDGAPKLDQNIAPTWTGAHIFANLLTGTTFNAPNATVATITVNGAVTNGAFVFNSAQTGTGAGSDLRINRASTTANAVEEGTNIELWDTGATTVTTLQQAGGQTELWMYNAGWNLRWRVTTTGAFAVPSSPLSSTITQAATGLANKKTADTTSANATLTADAALTVTCNETGYYKIEVFLGFYEATLGTGGFQFDLNAGSATVGGIMLGLDGFSTAALANAAVTSITTATASATVATSSSAPSWYFASGTVQITGTGTFGVRWAQNTISANVTTLKALSYITLTKIG